MSETKNTPPTTVVGIDLGTTFCAIAHADEDGVASTIVNREGDLTTPSAVLIESEEIVVGKLAVKAQTTVPENVAAFAKREVGKASFSKRVDGKTFTPEQIQSLILRQLKEDAEAKLGQKVIGAVITVPAYFNEPKRRSTIQSAKLAGLETLSIINEPTAAAIAYGLEKHAQIMGAQTVLIYDLGGGTFDASLVQVDGTDIKVIATDGNAMLGGIDWDRCLAKWLDDQFHAKHDFRPSETARGPEWLMQEAAELKHALTSRKEVKVRLSFQSSDLKGTVNQQTFDDLTAHLLDRTRFTASKLLKEANLRWRDVDQVILVGGSTRMPQVARMLTKLCGMDPNMSVSADEAIAHGAALLARSLHDESRQQSKDAASTPRLSVTDVNAHHLGVLGVDLKSNLPRNHVMIPRNTSLPATQTTRFQTIRENQSRVVVEVVEGGDPRGRYGTHIGRCILGGLPADLPAGSSVDVTFSYDRDGLIRVAARLPSTGQTAEIHVERNSVNLPSESVSDLSAEWSIDS